MAKSLIDEETTADVEALSTELGVGWMPDTEIAFTADVDVPHGQ